MDDFPANTNRSKEAAKKQAPKAERPKVEKVIKTEAKKIKKPFGTRFREIFLGTDAKSASSYITSDVLLPAVRNLIVDATSKGIERLIYGESSRGRRRDHDPGRPRMQYNQPVSRYSGRPGPMLPDQPPLRERRPRDSSEIVLVDRAEAELVLERLTDIIDQYEIASMADLYDLVGLPTTYVDNKWGWQSLAYADIRQIREGYLLDLPAAEPIS